MGQAYVNVQASPRPQKRIGPLCNFGGEMKEKVTQGSEKYEERVCLKIITGDLAWLFSELIQNFV